MKDKWTFLHVSNWSFPAVFSLAMCMLMAGAAVMSRAHPVAPSIPGNAGVITSAPDITIAGATADTGPTPSTGATIAHVQWKFGTVAGSYTTCTVQAKTTFDGANYLTLGSAASVTATSTTLNAWTLMAQAPVGTGVTTGAVSATAALGFGLLTKYTFACSGGYGTSAPVAVTTIYQ
jgi:hypothetical protein